MPVQYQKKGNSQLSKYCDNDCISCPISDYCIRHKRKIYEGVEMAEEIKKDDWVVQESAKYWNPSVKGEELVGSVTDVKKRGDFGETFTIKTDAGEEIKTPSHVALQNRMSRIDIGDRVKIVFDGEGEAQKGKNAPKLYTVFSSKAR